MISDVSFNKEKEVCNVSFNDLPSKFEAGTPDTSGIIGLGAAVDYLEHIGMQQVSLYEKLLTDYALKRLQELPIVVIYGHSCGSASSGIVSFGVKGFSSHDVALFLDNFGIAIRSGFHCAQPLHQAFKSESSARASFYVYNTTQEIDRFVEVLGQLAQS